ncbi:hypothetical protein PoB_005384500 [Plakobranchus ocellatus]|uniref:Uncharacterized protein n=1 Tax=Plakobranchus ocellatus TaxID=259542 RepID=A0AAV4C3U4_9GAST|nr:hypothetical protein PoB_005384500 [Plakobranchus ocellatus]
MAHPEKRARHANCRTYGTAVTPLKDFVQGLINPSCGTDIGRFPALGQLMRKHFFSFPAQTTHNSCRCQPVDNWRNTSSSSTRWDPKRASK